MPILQGGGNGWASALAGLIGVGGSFLQGQQDRKNRELEQQKQAQQNALIQAQIGNFQSLSDDRNHARRLENIQNGLDPVTGIAPDWAEQNPLTNTAPPNVQPGPVQAVPGVPAVATSTPSVTAVPDSTGRAVPVVTTPMSQAGQPPPVPAGQLPQKTTAPGNVDDLTKRAQAALESYDAAMKKADAFKAQAQVFLAHQASIPAARLLALAKDSEDAALRYQTTFTTLNSTANTMSTAATTAAATAAEATYRAGLHDPPPGLPPDQKIAYLMNRYNDAVRHGYDKVASATKDEIERLQTGQTIGETGRHNKVGEGQGAQRVEIERGNLDVNRGRLGVEQQGLGLRQQEFNAQFGTTPTPAVQAAWKRVQATADPAQRYAIIADPSNGLTDRQRQQLGGFVGSVATANNFKELHPSDLDGTKPVTSVQAAAAVRGAVSNAAKGGVFPPNDPEYPAIMREYANGTPEQRYQIEHGVRVDGKTAVPGSVASFIRQIGAQLPPAVSRPPSTAAPVPSTSPSAQPKTKINPANNKTYYLHADGNYYLSP